MASEPVYHRTLWFLFQNPQLKFSTHKSQFKVFNQLDKNKETRGEETAGET